MDMNEQLIYLVATSNHRDAILLDSYVFADSNVELNLMLIVQRYQMDIFSSEIRNFVMHSDTNTLTFEAKFASSGEDKYGSEWESQTYHLFMIPHV